MKFPHSVYSDSPLQAWNCWCILQMLCSQYLLFPPSLFLSFFLCYYDILHLCGIFLNMSYMQALQKVSSFWSLQCRIRFHITTVQCFSFCRGLIIQQQQNQKEVIQLNKRIICVPCFYKLKLQLFQRKHVCHRQKQIYMEFLILKSCILQKRRNSIVNSTSSELY